MLPGHLDDIPSGALIAPSGGGRPRKPSSPTYVWPAIRPQPNGDLKVFGRYRSPYLTTAVKLLLTIGLTLLGVAMLVASTLPSWYDQARFRVNGTMWEPICGMLWNLRHAEHWLFTDLLPGVGSATCYLPGSGFDIHMAVAGFLILCSSRLIAGPMARAVSWFAWPVLAGRVQITFEPKWIIVHRWWRRTLNIPRTHMDTNVSFRLVVLRERNPRLAEFLRRHNGRGLFTAEPAYFELVHGLRCHRLAMLESSELAQNVVVACRHAVEQTRSFD